MYCEQGGYHTGEQFEMICLNENCIQKGNFLSCIVCVEEYHKGHKLLALNKFVLLVKKQEQLIISSSTQNQDSLLDNQLQELNNLHQQIIINICKQKTYLESQLQFEKQIPCFKSLSQARSVKDISHMKQMIQKILLKMEYNPIHQQLNLRNQSLIIDNNNNHLEFLKKIYKINEMLNENQIQSTPYQNDKHKFIHTTRSARFSSTNEGYRTVRSFEKTPLSPQLDILSVTQSLSNQYYRPPSTARIFQESSSPPPIKFSGFQFHNEYHGKGVIIQNKIAKQVLNTQGNLVLIGPSIYGNGLIRDAKIKLKIMKCQNQNQRYPMAIGICDQKSAKQFDFEKQPLNSYLLNSNGYFNNQKVGGRFFNGNEIEMFFKPYLNQLIIRIDCSTEIILEIKLQQKQLFYFSIRLADLYDSIQILS